jgi:hypothetical protein
MTLCGGHGDRVNGIITTFILAVLTNRNYYIDIDSPIPIEFLLQPRDPEVMDWRISHIFSRISLQLSYIDLRRTFQKDLSWLYNLDSSVESIGISCNHRELEYMFSHPPDGLEGLVGNLKKVRFLAAEIWDLLFKPTPHLNYFITKSRSILPEKYIAIHFRAGDKTPGKWHDPARHGLDLLDQFFECAQIVEVELGLDPVVTKWFLSSDTALAYSHNSTIFFSHKIVFFENENLVHIDRSVELTDQLLGQNQILF